MLLPERVRATFCGVVAVCTSPMSAAARAAATEEAGVAALVAAAVVALMVFGAGGALSIGRPSVDAERLFDGVNKEPPPAGGGSIGSSFGITELAEEVLAPPFPRRLAAPLR